MHKHEAGGGRRRHAAVDSVKLYGQSHDERLWSVAQRWSVHRWWGFFSLLYCLKWRCWKAGGSDWWITVHLHWNTVIRYLSSKSFSSLIPVTLVSAFLFSLKALLFLHIISLFLFIFYFFSVFVLSFSLTSLFSSSTLSRFSSFSFCSSDQRLSRHEHRSQNSHRRNPPEHLGSVIFQCSYAQVWVSNCGLQLCPLSCHTHPSLPLCDWQSSCLTSQTGVRW